MNYENLLDPGLIQLAMEWETYEDEPTLMSRKFLGDRKIWRCRECDGMVFPEDFSGKLGHLLLEHGFRMNGRQYKGSEEV